MWKVLSVHVVFPLEFSSSIVCNSLRIFDGSNDSLTVPFLLMIDTLNSKIMLGIMKVPVPAFAFAWYNGMFQATTHADVFF